VAGSGDHLGERRARPGIDPRRAAARDRHRAIASET
jgi:hypothetical protein